VNFVGKKTFARVFSEFEQIKRNWPEIIRCNFQVCLEYSNSYPWDSMY
jgi:hypothetical protein